MKRCHRCGSLPHRQQNFSWHDVTNVLCLCSILGNEHRRNAETPHAGVDAASAETEPCSFHPGLLSNPGALKGTPEHLWCSQQQHDSSTPACYTRPSHYFSPARKQAPGHGKENGPTAARENFGVVTGADASLKEVISPMPEPRKQFPLPHTRVRHG